MSAEPSWSELEDSALHAAVAQGQGELLPKSAKWKFVASRVNVADPESAAMRGKRDCQKRWKVIRPASATVALGASGGGSEGGGSGGSGGEGGGGGGEGSGVTVEAVAGGAVGGAVEQVVAEVVEATEDGVAAVDVSVEVSDEVAEGTAEAVGDEAMGGGGGSGDGDEPWSDLEDAALLVAVAKGERLDDRGAKWKMVAEYVNVADPESSSVMRGKRDCQKRWKEVRPAYARRAPQTESKDNKEKQKKKKKNKKKKEKPVPNCRVVATDDEATPAMGSEAVGSEAVGSEAVGSEAAGSEAVGSEAVGSEEGGDGEGDGGRGVRTQCEQKKDEEEEHLHGATDANGQGEKGDQDRLLAFARERLRQQIVRQKEEEDKAGKTVKGDPPSGRLLTITRHSSSSFRRIARRKEEEHRAGETVEGGDPPSAAKPPDQPDLPDLPDLPDFPSEATTSGADDDGLPPGSTKMTTKKKKKKTQAADEETAFYGDADPDRDGLDAPPRGILLRRSSQVAREILKTSPHAIRRASSEGDGGGDRGGNGEKTTGGSGGGGANGGGDDDTSRVRASSGYTAFYHHGNGAHHATKEDNASTAIQALVRGYSCRLTLLRMSEAEEKAAATNIQNRFRGRLARKQMREAKTAREKEAAAAIMLQVAFRGKKARDTSEALREQRRQIALLAKRRAELLEEQKNAAITVQNRFRGQAARKHFQMLRQKKAPTQFQGAWIREKEVACARVLQTMYRGKKARALSHALRGKRRLREQQRRKEEENSAVSVQCAFRSKLAKRKMSQARDLRGQELAQAATAIQSRFRVKGARRRFRNAKTEKEKEEACALMYVSCMLVYRLSFGHLIYNTRTRTWVGLLLRIFSAFLSGRLRVLPFLSVLLSASCLLSLSPTRAYSPTCLFLSLQAPVRVAGKGGESHCRANTCDAGAVATGGGSGTSPERLAGKEGIPTCASNAGSADSPGRERGGSRTCGGAKGGRRDREGAACGGAACRCGGGENTAPSTGSGDSGGESAPGCECRGDSEAASGAEACEKWVLRGAVRVDEFDGLQKDWGAAARSRGEVAVPWLSNNLVPEWYYKRTKYEFKVRVLSSSTAVYHVAR